MFLCSFGVCTLSPCSCCGSGCLHLVSLEVFLLHFWSCSEVLQLCSRHFVFGSQLLWFAVCPSPGLVVSACLIFFMEPFCVSAGVFGTSVCFSFISLCLCESAVRFFPFLQPSAPPVTIPECLHRNVTEHEHFTQTPGLEHQ